MVWINNSMGQPGLGFDIVTNNPQISVAYQTNIFIVHATCLTAHRNSAHYDHSHGWSRHPDTGFDDHNGASPASLPCTFHWLRQKLGQRKWEDTS